MTPHEYLVACYALAASGRTEEARANLRRAPACLETPEGLDLLARIELALGNEDEARRLWGKTAGEGTRTRSGRMALEALDSLEWKYRKGVRWTRLIATALLIWAVSAVSGLLLGLCWKAASCNTEARSLEIIHQKTPTP